MRIKSMSAARAGFLLKVHCLEQACGPLAGDRCIYSKEPSPANPPGADHQGSHRQIGVCASHLPTASNSPSTSHELQQEQCVPLSILLADWHSCRLAGGEGLPPAQPDLSQDAHKELQ